MMDYTGPCYDYRDVENTRRAKTEYQFDANGNLGSITDDNGNQTTYSYDAKDRLTEVRYADGHFERFEFDRNDNLLAWVDANSTRIANTYDAAGRLTLRQITLDRVRGWKGRYRRALVMTGWGG